MRRDRHCPKRIVQVLSALTADFVTVPFNGEDPAQLPVMAAKG